MWLDGKPPLTILLFSCRSCECIHDLLIIKMLLALEMVVGSKTHMPHISSSSGIFVRLWKAHAGKNVIVLKLQNTKFCACMFAHCACGQLLLLFAYAVFFNWALLAFTHHQMFLHHRVWNPEFSFSSVLMCAIFPSIVLKLKLKLFPIVQHCVGIRSSCTSSLLHICSLLIPPTYGIHSLKKPFYADATVYKTFGMSVVDFWQSKCFWCFVSPIDDLMFCIPS